MKRSPALASLSRDHHQALVVAQKLRRATGETAADARSAFLAYWQEHGRAHFALEEDLLLPGYAAYGDPRHPLVLAVLGDHVDIRARADRLGAATEDQMRELGELMAVHVRREERELFPLIEEAMPEAELGALAAELERAEAEAT